MKKRTLGIGLLLTGFALTLGAFLIPSSKAEETLGYSTSSLPTRIDLNDTSDANVRSYYSSLNNLSQSERQGNNLLKNLKTILKNNQKYYKYDGDNQTHWQMYEITDRDWEKSPASSIFGYDSSTKIISSYNYGTSTSSKGTNPYIHALYINRDVTNQTRAWDDHQQTEWGINREHVWPKAEGFDTSGAGGARGDPMHLMAGNGYSNNIHSNNFYGYVDTSESYTDCGSKYSNQSGNLLGKSLNGGTSSNKVFEPQDCDKGDIARAVFYLVARYNYLSGSDSDGINSNNPNLALTQSLSDYATNGYTCSTTQTGKMGLLTDLLAWHHADPVDEYEIHRNNILYNNFTNNRNPFIDFPEWVDFIWGTTVYNGKSMESYNETPSGYATPSSDTINGYNGGSSDPVSVTGVSLNVNSTTIQVGNSEVLNATISPSNATNRNITWTSSNQSVATVSSSGRVEAVAEGNATITVTTSDGGYTATCSITVTEPSGPTESSYIKVSSLSALESGNYVIAANTSSSLKGMTYSFSSGKYSGTNVTATNDVISESDGNSRKFALTVSGSGDSRTVVVQDPNANKYVAYVSSTNLSQSNDSYSWMVSAGTNGTFRFTSQTSGRGLIYRLGSNNVFGGYATSNVSAGGSEYYDLELFKYTEVQTTKSLDSITLDTSDAPTTFNVGDTFSYEGLTVTANYDDGTDDIVTPTSISTPSMSSAGQKTVTVSYTEGGVTKTATYTITVNAVTLQAIEVSDEKTDYYVGDTFVKPTVTATYSNGSTSDVTDEATFTGYNLSSAGNQTVSVSYTNTITVTTSYSITVTALAVTSIDISGYKTVFKVGDTFSYGGTVIAHYNNGSTADVTESATFSGYNLSTAGNQTVTVSFSGQSQTYQIVVSDSGGATDSTQYELINSSSDLEIGKSYIITSGITGTVVGLNNTTYGNNRRGSDVTVSDNLITRGSSLMSLTLGGSSGSWTFYTENYSSTDGYLTPGSGSNARLFVNATNDEYGLFTISFGNSNNAVITSTGKSTYNVMRYNANNGSPLFACYTSGQGDIYLWKEVTPIVLDSISLDTTNVQKTFSIGDTFNYNGLVVTANYTDTTSATVTPTSVSSPDMSTTGNKTVTVSYTESNVTKTANYSITVNAQPSISWTAPTINVYSGSTLSGTDVNAWAVTYNDGAGHQTVLTYDQLTVKLGGTTISIPHTWVAADDGKTLTATYNSLTTSASSVVQITQSVNPIMKTEEPSSKVSDLTFTAACGGSGTADDGKTWTVTSDAAESNFDATKGIHYGTGSVAVEYIQLVSDSFTSGTITQVVVNASGASGVTGSVSVTVGGNAFGDVQSFNSTASDKTFTGSASAGRIVVRIYKASAAVKAIYCKSVKVTYTTSGSSVNIANSLDHIAAQRVAVKFAKAFNTAMATTSGCTTNMSSAWSACSSAYSTFLTEAAALGETEEAYAKDLIKYATAQYSDDSGEACIERMLKTYEVCVQKHEQTPFMSDLVSTAKAPTPLNPIVLSGNVNLIVIVVLSVVMAGAVGGYFYIRRIKQK